LPPPDRSSIRLLLALPPGNRAHPDRPQQRPEVRGGLDRAVRRRRPRPPGPESAPYVGLRPAAGGPPGGGVLPVFASVSGSGLPPRAGAGARSSAAGPIRPRTAVLRKNPEGRGATDGRHGPSAGPFAAGRA